MSSDDIILIGAGNIGKRTLQSLLHLRHPVNIFAIEPDNAARTEAMARAAEVPSGLDRHDITFVDGAESLPSHARLAIVATASGPRYAALSALFRNCRVENIVLEKFLFQEKWHYDSVRRHLEKENIRCWVNCPRPVWPGYQWMHQRVAGMRDSTMAVSGGRWNMASNAIHMLDCFSRVSNESIISVDGTGLDGTPLANKRSGYLEVSGRIEARGRNNGRVILECSDEPDSPLTIEWATRDGRYEIREQEQRVLFQSTNPGLDSTDQPFPVLMASELTNVYQDIMDKGDCGLTRYNDSSALHLMLIDVFNDVFYPNSPEANPCPVT